MSLFKQIMLIIAACIENYQKIMLNPKKHVASRYSQPLLTYKDLMIDKRYLAV